MATPMLHNQEAALAKGGQEEGLANGGPLATDAPPALAAKALAGLCVAVWGEVLTPEDGQPFQDALKTWSVSPFRGSPPAVVVRARGTQDVVEAVKYARQQGLALSVKGGGHGAGNPSWGSGGGVVVDLSHMRSCSVDPSARIATVDGGCLLADIDRETALYGLAVPLGTAPLTGMGLVVNGGYGILSRKYGPTCASMLEVQLVNAGGEVVTINKDSDPELFWAARGAASTLGVVTRIKLRLYDVSHAYTGVLVYADDPQHETFKAIIRWMRDSGGHSPDLGMVMLRMADPHSGPTLICMVVHVGPEGQEEKQAFFQPLRDLGPKQDTLGQSTYAQTQACLLPALRGLQAAFPEHFEYWTGGSIEAEGASEAAIEKVVECLAEDIPMPQCALSLSAVELLGGVLCDAAEPMGYRDGLSWVLVVGWADPGDHALGVGYAKRVKAALAPCTTLPEPYVNFNDFSAAEPITATDAAIKVGGPANLARLRAVKQELDPQGVFSSTPFRKALAAGKNSGARRALGAEE